MSRVLVIAASMAQAEDMMRQHATHNYRDIEFRYPANISAKEASLQVGTSSSIHSSTHFSAFLFWN